MKKLLIITLLLQGICAFTQNLSLDTGETYAVVVGISDYQDEAIPDLRFADKDAEAFAGFLQSPAGGSLDEDHLKVLINEQATGAQIAMELDWLIEVAKADDKVIIYFSGHGDVEAKRVTQPGYLLGWDAPPRVYMAGGAVNLRDLQIISSTLTIENKAKVVIITDACRAGKLAGSAINGSQIVGSNLSKTVDNEIKILSCQPDEYSIEGEQWGGGRGAFSYHLLDGLTGMADGDENFTVNLKEIGRYLEDRVTEEVSPQAQNPMVVGNKTEKLTDVFPKLLEELKQGKKGQLQLFTSTDSRSVEDDVLAALSGRRTEADSNIVEMYLAFQKALKDKKFLEPDPDNYRDCADFYYGILSQEPQLKRLYSSMRRNYAAALQDDAQQVLNKLLKSDPWEVNKSQYKKNKNYGQYPELIRRAANLLGKEHYMYDVLLARSYWFEGYINDESVCACKNKKNAKKIIPYYKKALNYQPEMPHAYMQLSAVYGIQLQQPDSAEYFAELALKNVPNWVAVYDWVANSCLNTVNAGKLSETQKEHYMDKAKVWLDRGLAIDSNSILLLNDLGFWHSLRGEYSKEQMAYDRALAVDTTATTLEFKATGLYWWGKFEDAAEAWEKCLMRDPDNLNVSQLFSIYYLLGQDDKAKKLLRELLNADIKTKNFYKYIGVETDCYYPEESIELLKKSIEIDGPNAWVYNELSYCYAFIQPINLPEHARLLRKAIELRPDKATYHNNLGFCLMAQNELQKAEEAFLMSRSLSKKWAGSHAGLYLLNSRLGKHEEAKKELATGMKKNDGNFLHILSWWIWYSIPEASHIEEHFDEIEKAYPNNPLVNYEYAQYLSFHKQDIPRGLQQLEQALQKGYKDSYSLLRDRRLRNLWKDKEKWNTLMDNYFPEKFKN